MNQYILFLRLKLIKPQMQSIQLVSSLHSLEFFAFLRMINLPCESLDHAFPLLPHPSAVLGIESGTSCMLGKPSNTTELHSQHSLFYFETQSR